MKRAALPFSARHNRQSGWLASAAMGEMKGRPQHAHMGGPMGKKEARHSLQMGMRLALASVSPQMRQGAGNRMEESASSAFRKITEALLTAKVRV